MSQFMEREKTLMFLDIFSRSKRTVNFKNDCILL